MTPDKHGWLPISTEPLNPGMYLTVAIFPNGEPCYDFSTFFNGEWRDSGGDHITPKAWQPLPQPPETV